jgi:hypothetical protein
MSRTELEKRILRLYKGGTGILKIGKTLGVGTGTVQRVVTEQTRPFDVDVAESYAVQWLRNGQWCIFLHPPREEGQDADAGSTKARRGVVSGRTTQSA